MAPLSTTSPRHDFADTTPPASPTSPRDSTPSRSFKYHDKEYSEDDDDHSSLLSDDDRRHSRDGLLNTANLDPLVAAVHAPALPVEDEEHVQTAVALQVDASSPQNAPPEKPQAVTWSSLPNKGQLMVLTFARLSEPLIQNSLLAYMYHQLRSFDTTLPDATISYQAGLLQATFTFAQFCTAFLWGRVADHERWGRKRVILIGLLGTSVGALGFGFSQSFRTAMFWRAVGGALNGNVAVLRTMISEIIKEKKYQSRAFLILPMTFNIGVVIGPMIGGLLADPVTSYPGLFGEHSTFGGEDGVWWMKKWPYALPNMVTAGFMAIAASAAVLGLEETLEARRGKRDFGLRLADLIRKHVFRRRPHQEYQSVPSSAGSTHDVELHGADEPQPPKRPRAKLPFRRIFTFNLISVLIAHGMLACHLGAFNNLWFIFLSSPRYVPSSIPSNSTTDPNHSYHLPPNYQPKPPFIFTGGLGLPPAKVGTSLAILGTIGVVLQLGFYPRVSFRYGLVTCYRLSLLLFPIVYALVPFLARVPSSTLPPLPAAGWLFWLVLVVLLFAQTTARTFALPGTTILLNNASPHPSALATVHGLGQSVSSFMRTIGPLAAGFGFGAGAKAGVVGAVFWALSVWAAMGAVAGQRVREGTGHEIWLEGEEEEEQQQRQQREGK